MSVPPSSPPGSDPKPRAKTSVPGQPPARRVAKAGARANMVTVQTSTSPLPAATPGSSDMPMGIAVSTSSNDGGTVPRGRAGGLRDMVWR